MPDANAENQIRSKEVKVISPPVRRNAASAIISIRPTSTTASTVMNRPKKKKRVVHSMSRRAWWGSVLLQSIRRVAPVRAIVAGSRCNALWSKNPKITAVVIINDLRSKMGSVINADVSMPAISTLD